MRTEGSIERKGLPELLLGLGREGGTGILTIQGSDDIIAFAFLEGGIVSADALNQTMEDGLGQVLAEEGLCGADDFAHLASEYQSGGGQVVDLLVERGFVDRPQLLEAVRTHTYQLCRRALGWTEGEFKFYRGDEVSYEEGVSPISPEELLIRAGRDLDRELLPGGAPPSDMTYRRKKGAEPSAGAAAAGGLDELDEEVLAAFKLIDGKLPVAELAERSGVAEYRMAYLLHRWEAAGMVEPAGRQKPRRKPAKSPEPAPPPKAPAPRESVVRSWFAPAKGKRREAQVWPSRVLGLLFLASIAISFYSTPSSMLLPFPWQRGLQESLDRERTSAVLSLLRRANGAHFLLHGRFAEDLADLTGAGLLHSADLEDERGRPLAYSATEASYVVRSSIGVETEREALLQETIRGNFLLDPELELPAESRRPLLVLLD